MKLTEKELDNIIELKKVDFDKALEAGRNLEAVNLAKELTKLLQQKTKHCKKWSMITSIVFGGQGC